MDQQQIAALWGLDESARKLIGLYCADHISKDDVENWFAGIEFEALRPEVSCMAAAMAAANDYSGVPSALEPRLRGIMRYVHTLNSGMTAGLCALAKRYNEDRIPAVLLGSAAVHLGHQNPPRRHIWQMEMAVAEEDFPQAAALAADAGFTIEQTPYSVTAKCGNTQRILVRKGIACGENAREVTLNGVPFLVPSGESLLISLADGAFQSLFAAAPGAKLIPWIMDLHCVSTAIASWEAVAAAAAKQGKATQVRLALEFYCDLAPNALDAAVLDLFGPKNATVHLAQLLLKYRRCGTGKSRLKRLWLRAQIRSEGSFSGALSLFFADLRQAILHKLTGGS